jgi:hypothetical protein
VLVFPESRWHVQSHDQFLVTVVVE